MNALDFYDEKNSTFRKLEDGDGLRNSHNFIKAVLIKRFIDKKKKILDLGCGQGGDLIKLKFSQPSLYVGIDISPKSVFSAQQRASKINMRCRCHFMCSDFTKHDWDGYPPYDVINCQFAIQYAFKSLEEAQFTFDKISRFLVEDGLFIGTLPQHEDASTFSEVTVQLPDDNRFCKEYSVRIDDLTQICEKYNLYVVLLERFDKFHASACRTEQELVSKMRGETAPDANNYVFAFQKRTLK